MIKLATEPQKENNFLKTLKAVSIFLGVVTVALGIMYKYNDGVASAAVKDVAINSNVEKIKDHQKKIEKFDERLDKIDQKLIRIITILKESK